jgi:molybdopterin converting factor small subunit
MSIKIDMFYPHMQEYAGNRKTVNVEGQTVGECLQDLAKQYPGVEKFVFDEKGKYLKHVFVYVNAESASKAGLKDPVKDGDEILVAVLITGG